MITLRHIEIYKKYNGDGDGFVRCATQEEKSIMDYKYWSLIDNLVQDISFIKKGITSDTFIISLVERLKENCDNEETIKVLKEI